MRRSELFVKTRKEVPADEESKNAQLLIRAGFIHKEMAGVYSYLPLGMRVLDKIKAIVREEMNSLGGQELVLSTLQPPQLWQATDRWSDEKVDVWFKSTIGEGSEVGFAWSHEEPMARMMTQFVSSYKDLPVYTYQFQNKLRRELRAKSGLLRAREFIMKDLYSFSQGQKQHEQFYQQVSDSYMNIYQKLGIGNITHKTFASGGAFSKFSHEFQTLSPVGEDTIYFHEHQNIAINKEVLTDEVLAELGVSRDGLVEKTAVEVGNIFTFGSRYSEPLGLYFTDERGNQQPVFMGSYGIGISRLMGLLAEHFADEHGLVWPEVVAPFRVYLASIGGDENVVSAADELYRKLKHAKVDVLFDDRDERPGEKFADAELMGLPYRVVISEKSLQAGGYELKERTSEEAKVVAQGALIDRLA